MSMDQTKNNKPYVFFEGPPSANGLPGIHHVLARTIKDIFLRYKTMKGYYVKEKQVGTHMDCQLNLVLNQV